MESAEETIERVEIARAELLESVSELNVDELLGAHVLFGLAPNFKDLVNFVFSTQSSPIHPTFEQATASIRRLVSAGSVGEADASSGGLLGRRSPER